MALWCGIDDNWQLFTEVGMASDGYFFLQRLQYFLSKVHTIMTWQRLEPWPLSPESVAKTTLPYMLTPFIVKTEKKKFAPERKSDRYYFSVYNARSLTISLTIYNQ